MESGGDRQPGPPRPTSGQLVSKQERKNAPAWREAIRVREMTLFAMYWEISPL